MKEIVLDAGALIALERDDRKVRTYVSLAERGLIRLRTCSPVVAQVWRGGGRQARLARLLNGDLVDEIAFDVAAGRRVGALAATTGATDVIDGHVAAIALEHDAVVVTSDVDDIARWGVPRARLVRC